MKRNVWIGIAASVLLIAALAVVGVTFYNIGISRGVSTAADLEGLVFPGGPLSQKVYLEGGAEGFPILMHRFPPFFMGLLGFVLQIVLLRTLARLIFFPFFGLGAMRMGPHPHGWRPMGRHGWGDADEMDTPPFLKKWHSQMHDAEDGDEVETSKA
ncbi:MAG: hypothetical protein MUO58_09350 [Anaerolineales bacterium]|nr:hypothetical protein [Anaerolineales bacterium]